MVFITSWRLFLGYKVTNMYAYTPPNTSLLTIVKILHQMVLGSTLNMHVLFQKSLYTLAAIMKS